MEIKNTTVMTEEFYLYFQRFSMMASKLMLALRILSFAIMIGANIYIIYNALELLIVYSVPDLIPYMLLLIVFTVIWMILRFGTPKRMFKKYHLRDATIKFTFCDDKIIDETISGTINGKSEVYYKNFNKIYETDKLILIYVDHMHVFPIDKNGFEDESDIPCVREILRGAVGDKKYKYFAKK
ncbi:MAG: YcxB family protein [Clostridia bacterium]|nr:YcxB family protein [Clostridia bacterium]